MEKQFLEKIEAFSDLIMPFLGPFKLPFWSIFNSFSCEKFLTVTYFASFNCLQASPIKNNKKIRGNQKRHIGSIFCPFWTHLGQIMTKANVEILIMKASMFNHETPDRKNVFYFIKKMLWNSGATYS